MAMHILGNLMYHFRLVARMAKVTGTDLVGASRAGDLSQEDWAEMVQTCRACNWVGTCPDWLNAHDASACAPEICLNRGRFQAIRAAAQKHETEVA